MEVDPDLVARAIGRKLKAARKAKGMTQEQLAKQVGISTRRLGDIERGVARNLQLKTLVAVINALDLTENVKRLLDEPIEKQDYTAETAFQAAFKQMKGESR